MKLMHAMAVVLTAGLVAAWSLKRRPPSVGAAILSLARSMDVSHLYSRHAPGSTGESTRQR